MMVSHTVKKCILHADCLRLCGGEHQILGPAIFIVGPDDRSQDANDRPFRPFHHSHVRHRLARAVYQNHVPRRYDAAGYSISREDFRAEDWTRELPILSSAHAIVGGGIRRRYRQLVCTEETLTGVAYWKLDPDIKEVPP